jgi:hypothetical protein
MNDHLKDLVWRGLASGSVAAAAVSVAVGIIGRRIAGSAAAPFNATSHVAWGERAALEDGASLKYTGTGIAANYGACVFWAMLYEALGRGRPRSPARALLDGALVSATAYTVDYHLIPRRLTPGFELRVPAPALAGIFAVLALGLAASDVLVRKRRA